MSGMQIVIESPGPQTAIFATLFFLALILLTRSRKDFSVLPLSLTNELKGLAILMVIFGHIGYFLSNRTEFLSPLSAAPGVGVDMFLLLSGYGLTASGLKKKISIGSFYLKRVPRLFIPLWISMLLFVLLDFFILHRTYDWGVLFQIALGFIQNADIYGALNSPLWFITPIVFYYLLFPLFFSRRGPELSALLFYAAGAIVLYLKPHAIDNVYHLYNLHEFAFPLGVLTAGLIGRCPEIRALSDRFLRDPSKSALIGRLTLFTFALVGALYYSVNSGVNSEKYIHQTISLVTVFLYVATFSLKPVDLNLFGLVGLYSYEVYLLHWPLAYRYGFFYQLFPAGLATAAYVAFLLALAYGLNWLSTKITRQ